MTPDRVVFSGAGGGLLDQVTGSHEGARPAIAALARLGVPLVLCSSRPRGDVMLVSRLLGLGAPVIVENGAALIVPDGHLRGGVPGGERDGGFQVLRLGPRRETLREALTEVAAARGLRVARGERLYHLCGGADKGLAARTLLSLYQREGRLPRTIALGAWQVDLPMLRAVHRPIVLPGPGGGVEPLLAAELRHAERARRGGPEGWNDAVLTVLAGHSLPTVYPEARLDGDRPLVCERSRRTA